MTLGCKRVYNVFEKELMADDLLFDKTVSIVRCVSRGRDEYGKDPIALDPGLSHQNATIVNVLCDFDA
ncbi:hypothetical protein ALO94_100949 [Pseudomonas syringae pv. spinaceae]|uniref:Uncharacterized protein n=2 Tax=Pseudomonas syringae TaxID=317 RepID=A0A0Q0B8E7_PSESX|nr:hypothetical protein ALO94_100949 [Pseudomonas syringae pv. spinaceae]